MKLQQPRTAGWFTLGFRQRVITAREKRLLKHTHAGSNHMHTSLLLVSPYDCWSTSSHCWILLVISHLTAVDWWWPNVALIVSSHDLWAYLLKWLWGFPIRNNEWGADDASRRQLHPITYKPVAHIYDHPRSRSPEPQCKWNHHGIVTRAHMCTDTWTMKWSLFGLILS